MTDPWARERMEQVRQALLDQFEVGGLFTYRADATPIDSANYDDPHKPRDRRPVVDDDLEGWEPL